MLCSSFKKSVSLNSPEDNLEFVLLILEAGKMQSDPAFRLGAAKVRVVISANLANSVLRSFDLRGKMWPDSLGFRLLS